MRAFIQRVSQASVSVDNKVTGRIGKGLLVFLGIRVGDTEAQADLLARKVVGIRIFPDSEGKMNCNLLETAGELLVVSQFTLYGNTAKGHRPFYSDAAPAHLAKPLYEYFIASCRHLGAPVSAGVFQAHMLVNLTNDGPVTLLCEN